MSLSLLIGADEFWPAFVADVQTARHRVYVKTLTFEADRAGLGLAGLLRALPATVDRRLILDDYSRYLHNDRFLFTPRSLADRDLWRERHDTLRLLQSFEREGIGVRWTNPMHGLAYRLARRNHKKLLVVDDRVAYIGGINFSDHNFGWHDLMLRIDDPEMIAFLADDFLAMWNGVDQGVERRFRDGRIILLDGRHGPELHAGLFAEIAAARKEVWAESPYVSAPFYDPMLVARQRGARILIHAPAANNWGLYDEYTRIECWERGFELWHQPWKMFHLKAMLIDGRTLVIGSSNFDYFSYLLHQELLFVTQDEALVADFRARVYDRDSGVSTRESLSGRFSLRTRWAHLKLKTGFPVTVWLNRRF
jgi:cardiolipin synthase A/B